MAPVLAGLVLAVVNLDACEHSPSFIASYTQATNSNLGIADRERAFESSIRSCSQDVRLYGEFGALLITRRDFAGALSWIDKGLRISPKDHSLQIQKAAALLPLGRAQEVIAMLGPVPTGEAQFYKGLAFRSLQKHAEAREYFQRALELGYENPYVLYSIIQEEYTLGDKQSGLQHFQLLLKKYPDAPWVHLLLADAYFTKEKTNEARNEYLKALQLKPDLLGANFRLGYMAFQDGELDAAAQYFSKEISLNPTYVDAVLFLSETLLQLDRKQEALVQLRRALTLDSKSDLIYKRLATTLIETDRLQEASSTLKKAEMHFPEDPAFPAQLARVYTLLNQAQEAQDQAERARQLTADQHRKEKISPVR